MNVLGVKKFFYKVLVSVTRISPLRNLVVFNSYNGKGISDDPKYIAQEILRRNAGIELVWLVKNVKTVSLPIGIKAVKYGSLRASFYLSLARVWVDNCRGISSWVMKRKGQFYIQTWHSTFGIKKLGTDNNKSSKARRRFVSRDMKYADLMYSNSDFRVNKYKTTFWYDGPVIKCDVPRVAFIMSKHPSLRKEIERLYGLSDGCNIAIYAPTFRDNYRDDVEVYQYDFGRIIEAINLKFCGNFVMLVRLHPNLKERGLTSRFNFTDRIIDATQYPDMDELLCVADVLFTDFSSSMFDFGIARKPVFLMAKDYQRYISLNRELYFTPKKELPFSFSESEEELIDAISKFEEDSYKRSCDDFFNKIGLEDHGNGDKILADIVMSKMKF